MDTPSSICAGACALWAAGLTFAALGLYLWLVFGLRRLLLPGVAELSAPALRQEQPGLGWLPLAHEVLSWPALFGAIVAGAVAGDLLFPRPAAFGAGALLAVAGLSLFSALFELASGVSPCYGPIINRHSRQRYTVGPAARCLGLVRLAIGAAIVAAVTAGAALAR